MDVDSLRAELEAQVAKIPHQDAPDGFRDRFDHVAECLKSGEGDCPQSALEAQLQQIRDEAEAAAKAGAAEAAGGEEDRAAPMSAPQSAPKSAPAPAPRQEPEPEPASFQRYGIAAGIVVVLLVAAYFYLR
jgi:cell division septation protein DedD